MPSRMRLNNLMQMLRNNYEDDGNRDTDLPLLKTQKQKDTALRAAVENGDENATLELLRIGADANHTDILGYTCIHHAVLKGRHRLITHLVEYGADIEKNILYGAQAKPIHLIVYSEKKIECLEELLKYNVRLDSKDRLGNTVLHLMVTWAPTNIKLIERILSTGLDPNQVDQKGNNCMHLLAVRTAPETEALADIFVKKGIDIECKNTTNGETPLHIACRSGNTYVVDFLLKAGADINVLDKNGSTAFDNISTSEAREAFSVFVKYLVLRMERGYIVADNFQQKIKSTKLYEDFVQDINLLKFETVSSSCHVTYYDILCGNVRDVANYLKTTKIREQFTRNYNNISTMYKRELRNRFEEAKRLHNEDEYVYTMVDKILDARLPHLCVAKISSYLTPDDLQRLSRFKN